MSIADPHTKDAVTNDAPIPRLTHIPTSPTGLPIAQARNTGANTALRAGAELLIFLDVDCIPSPTLVARYHETARIPGSHLFCGPVAYLPPQPAGGYQPHQLPHLATPHPARPNPPDGHTIHSHDHTLFWSLSFAVTATVWTSLDGFCQDYTGYGGEDTDYGQLARAAGIDICWIGGANAYHQYHPVSEPPIEHLNDILRNSTLFHRRWGWWPMTGWLSEFERQGLIRYHTATETWHLTTHG